MNPLFPAKVLIRTGPLFKDAGCTENADVELDLVPPGKSPTGGKSMAPANRYKDYMGRPRRTFSRKI
jgi:hypothetical protein